MREFVVQHPHGVLAGIELTDVDAGLASLLPDDVAYARALKAARQTSYVAGRVALGRALARIGAEPTAIGIDDRGAPVLPAGFAGSISHKGAVAVALAAPRGTEHLGVDVERLAPMRPGLAAHVLTARELASVSDDARILASFSVKEAIYKAIDPIVRRYVGFHEVELSAFELSEVFSTVGVRLLLAETLPLIEATVATREDHLIATARLMRTTR